MLRTSLSALAVMVCANAVLAQSSITPLASFGSNGWLAPGAIGQLDTSNSQRSMSLNPLTGNVVVVDRDGTLGNNAWVIDGVTGAVIGALTPPAAGYSGGTFVVNCVDVAEDGSIYVCNLVTSTASTFKVYKWDSEAAGLTTPATEILVSPGPSGAWGGMNRIGDCFAVTGGGANPVQFAAAGSNSAAGTNSAFLNGVLDGNNLVTPYLAIPGTVSTSNGYRLGLTFVDGDTLIGTQGTTAYITSYDGTSATLDGSVPTGAAQRPIDYAVIGGVPVLATVDTNSSNVFVYDISNPASPYLLTVGNATSGTLSANANATGGCAWGPVSGNTATLYAMSSNQGVQAFSVTVGLARTFPIGAGCGSPALTLGTTVPVLGSTMTLTANNIAATAPIVIYAFGSQEIPGGLPLPIPPLCTAYINPDLLTITNISAGTGTDSASLALPADPYFVGLEIFSQCITLDVSGDVVTSNGRRLRLDLN